MAAIFVTSPYEVGNKVCSRLSVKHAALDESRLELKAVLGQLPRFLGLDAESAKAAPLGRRLPAKLSLTSSPLRRSFGGQVKLPTEIQLI